MLAVFAAVAAALQHPAPGGSITELIQRGESDRLEFKSSARWNLHTSARDEKIEMVIAKAVAGFLNTDGGTLLIGVNDDGDIVGLVNDFRVVKSPDADRYELWLRDFLAGTLGQNAAATPVIDFTPVDRRRSADLRLPGDLPVLSAPGVHPAGQGRRAVGDVGADGQLDPAAEGGRGRRLRDAPVAARDRPDGGRPVTGGRPRIGLSD